VHALSDNMEIRKATIMVWESTVIIPDLWWGLQSGWSMSSSFGWC